MSEPQAQISFKLENFKTLRFACEQYQTDLTNNDDVMFNHTTRIAAIKEQQSVIVNIIIDVLFPKDSTNPLAHAEIQADFKIVNGFEQLDVGDKMLFPTELMATFIAITFSTTRGVLIEKFAATSLRHVLLPIINPREIAERVLEKAQQISENITT